MNNCMGVTMKQSIAKKLQNWFANLTWRTAFHAIIGAFFFCLFALFFDWLIINWISGCCEGGVCIPEWLYPQCIVHEVPHAL